MITKYIEDRLSLKYENRILIYDFDDMQEVYENILRNNGYILCYYDDVEAFRKKYEEEIKFSTTEKYAVIVKKDLYVPYDIKLHFYITVFGIKELFPKLNDSVLKKYKADFEIIAYAYEELLEEKLEEAETEKFVVTEVFSKRIVEAYIVDKSLKLVKQCENKFSYTEWINVGKLKARLMYYAARVGLEFNSIPEVDEKFNEYLMTEYKALSSVVNSEYPVILPKVLPDFINDKTALIVMDGMSMFDFEIISRNFKKIEYEEFGSFALIPTVTAISRQSLMAGKYPRELENPFSLGKEKSEFFKGAMERGFKENQVQYERGYEISVSPLTKLLGVIINEVDDLMHGQHQGQIGMYNDILLMAKEGKLEKLINILLQEGFQVLITADHGNTCCVGAGGIRGFGVETETRSKRMLVLKEFGQQFDKIKDKMYSYPGYYMDKKYQYFVCKNGMSLDNEGEKVITHGGITIEEVIVPFIKIKAV